MKKPKPVSPELLKEIVVLLHDLAEQAYEEDIPHEEQVEKATAYEEAARRVEGAPKIGMTRVWKRLDIWFEQSSYWHDRPGPAQRRKIAALVRAELKRGGR